MNLSWIAFQGLAWRKGLTRSLSHLIMSCAVRASPCGHCAMCILSLALFCLHSAHCYPQLPCIRTQATCLCTSRKRSKCGSFNPNSYGTNLLQCFIVITTTQIPSHPSLFLLILQTHYNEFPNYKLFPLKMTKGTACCF